MGPPASAPPAKGVAESDDGNDDGLVVPVLVGTAIIVALAAGAGVIATRRRRARELARRQAPIAPQWPSQPPTYHPPGSGPYDRR
ncbi:hypothetical protein [Embleya scabrispora]|uniref:hypothetical protein n=1 Tax=Embleya scabrispora TaxID=159449 RepID=UPI001F2474D4|nr:hypothetical protein [Embleya scabrispora]